MPKGWGLQVELSFKNSDNKRQKDIGKLRAHLETMKKELNQTQDQIKVFEKSSKKISEWDNLENISGKSIKDLREQESKLSKEISSVQKELKSRSKVLLLTEISLLPVVMLLLIISGVGPNIMDNITNEQNSLSSRYLVENLRGDTLDTWKSWRLVGTTMNVNIISPSNITPDKVDVVSNAISSMEAISIDNSLLHKGPKGTSSLYYTGWKGALNDISSKKGKTQYNLPTEFNVMKSKNGEGDIIITLSNLKDVDGYTGYTKSVVEGNEILKSFITIYDVNNLTDEQLATITRHEFGHALGLGHSTAPEDLMAPTIDMTYPFISECNVSAMFDLYNGNAGSKTVCEI